jgi:hypothetical protein
MLQQQQHGVDSLRRTRAFLVTYAGVLGPLKETEAGKQLDLSLERATAHALDQGTAIREFAGSGEEAKRLAVDLKVDNMTPFAKFARANLRGAPNFNALAHVPHNLRGHSLVAAARAMATAALPYADKLEAAQFPVDSVQQLASAADALHAALEDRVAAQSRRVIATAGVRHELALGREAVAMLDPIVTKRLAGQKDLLAGWRSAKRVKQMPTSEVVPVAPVARAAGAQEVQAA